MSRYLPFHSAQRPYAGNEPTWYRPPASHASAISLQSAEDRIVRQVLQQRRVGQRHAHRVAAEDRGQIEAEAVDVVLGHPVAQAVEHQLRTTGLLQLSVLPQPLKLK